MAPPALPPIPAALKSVQHYLKVANDYDTRDPPVSYWCKNRSYDRTSSDHYSDYLITGRFHALQQGLVLKKSKEDMVFLLALMDWLEKTKLELKSQEV